ncbi:hypothetical protein CH380_03495 [Leptospira adleri]|uniref:Uncharacterized protein n=1 Tax=Leptospira adleri TaxID=2023186 RepID=A0A2M9YTC9_9LEPT|nr:hypothetical protein CH380_03495 [Leptospira adleri]PJZ61450.1 hypothetical protein CH376_13220 [Leptospira adleri]
MVIFLSPKETEVASRKKLAMRNEFFRGIGSIEKKHKKKISTGRKRQDASVKSSLSELRLHREIARAPP